MLHTRSDHGFTLLADQPVGTWLRRIMPLLSSVLHGRDAERIVNSGIADLPQKVGLVVLPGWVWKEADPAAVGRKAGNGTDGLHNFLPFRLNWQPGTVCLVTSESSYCLNEVVVLDNGHAETPIAWSALGPGHSSAGTLDLVDDAQGPQLPSGVGPHTEVCRLGSRLPVTAMDRGDVADALKNLISRGEMAYWDLLAELEGELKTSLERAHAGVSREIGDSLGLQCNRLLDDIALEQVRSDLTFGSDGQSGKSRMMSLIEQCLEPGRFDRVDPQRFITITLRREAGEGIRRRLSDPHIGRKIRRLLAENPQLSTAEEIIEKYRSLYPSDRLSYERLNSAISVRPDPMANTQPLTWDDGEERWPGIWRAI